MSPFEVIETVFLVLLISGVVVKFVERYWVPDKAPASEEAPGASRSAPALTGPGDLAR